MAITIKRTLCPTGSVENSDATYSTTVDSGGSLVLPDSQINVNGTDEGDVVSVKTIDVNITDGVNPVTPDSVSLVGNTLTVAVPSGGASPAGATLMPSGQSTVYRTGDDADNRLVNGRTPDFLTLNYTNPFGNTNRFTDELGGSTYTNNIVIDWSTYDSVAGTVLGYYKGDLATNRIWDDAIDWAVALSVGTFTTGWRLMNRNEANNIINDSVSAALGYSPFNYIVSVGFWTSTTTNNATTYATALINPRYSLERLIKTSLSRTIAVRNFTVTGTTLT